MREEILALLDKRLYGDEEILALGQGAVPDLIALFDEVAGDWADTHRRAIVYMLGLLDGAEAVNFLVDRYHQVEGVDETMQVALVNALARTDHDEALALVLPLLSAADKRLRKNALVGLRTSTRPEVLAQILTLIQTESDESLRRHAQIVAAEIETRIA